MSVYLELKKKGPEGQWERMPTGAFVPIIWSVNYTDTGLRLLADARKRDLEIVNVPDRWEPQLRVRPIIGQPVVTYKVYADIAKEEKSCRGEMVSRLVRRTWVRLLAATARGMRRIASMIDPGTT